MDPGPFLTPIKIQTKILLSFPIYNWNTYVLRGKAIVLNYLRNRGFLKNLKKTKDSYPEKFTHEHITNAHNFVYNTIVLVILENYEGGT